MIFNEKDGKQNNVLEAGIKDVLGCCGRWEERTWALNEPGKTGAAGVEGRSRRVLRAEEAWAQGRMLGRGPCTPSPSQPG